MDVAWSVKADAAQTATQVQLNAFNHDHVCFRGTMAHFARLAILLAIEPFLGTLGRFELKQDIPLRVPVPFEHFRSAAAHDVFAAVLFYGRAGKVLVLFVTRRIENVDFNNHVSGHGRNLIKKATKVQSFPRPLRSFAANSGTLFRRRSRSQLFQVLRRLSRGVWYFWLSSLLLTICARTPFTEKSSVFTIVYAVPTAAV